MYILGLSTMTDSAAVLLKNGRVVAAAEEERFTRVKQMGGIPFHAIAHVLTHAKISMDEVEHVAISWNPYRMSSRFQYLVKTFFTNPVVFLEKIKRSLEIWRGATGDDSGWGSLFDIDRKLLVKFAAKRPINITFLDHHDCHMASAFYPSSFDESAILIMDGAGESSCTTWGVGKGVHFRTIREFGFPHSLGHFYSAVTGYLGFKMLEGEYKLMGLSSLGQPSGAKWISENFLIPQPKGGYRLQSNVLDYHRALKGDFRGQFSKHFGQPRPASEQAPLTERHMDIAASTQAAFERVVLAMTKQLALECSTRSLVIAGGCGLNSVANGKIMDSGEFNSVYVPSVPNDAGGSLGAALLRYVQVTGKRPEPIVRSDFGPAFTCDDIEQELNLAKELNYERVSDRELVQRCAQLIASEGVVAWMQGRMEYGPRALGHRSLLADPRHKNIRQKMNGAIKLREGFRPFAPSVKKEKAQDYFHLNQASPFMSFVVQVKPEKRELIPAVVHFDGSARPQTVDRTTDPLYWGLIDEFEKVTGIPMVLNTSFNIQEPIVCTPKDAINTFQNSKINALAIGPYWVTRNSGQLE